MIYQNKNFNLRRISQSEIRNSAALCVAREMASKKSERLVLVGMDGFEPSTPAL